MNKRTYPPVRDPGSILDSVARFPAPWQMYYVKEISWTHCNRQRAETTTPDTDRDTIVSSAVLPGLEFRPLTFTSMQCQCEVPQGTQASNEFTSEQRQICLDKI